MTVLLGQSTTGALSANSNAAGTGFAQRLQALASGTITRIWIRTGAGTLPTGIHAAIYADNAGTIDAATRLTGDIIGSGFSASAWNSVTVSPGLAVVSGTFYWIEWLGTGNAFAYTDFATTGGTEKDTSGLSSLPTPHGTSTGSNANIANVYADDTGSAVKRRARQVVPIMRAANY